MNLLISLTLREKHIKVGGQTNQFYKRRQLPSISKNLGLTMRYISANEKSLENKL